MKRERERERERTSALAYRPDIDGLRAFAVLSVVFYHAFPNTLKGGFIGVDVFFVISGYLIGSIIMSDLEQNKFSFLNFYARRIRRIFPALIVVLSSALLFGWFALFPDEYKSLGKHAFGGAAFIDNFLLWQESGYFDVSSQLKPLLHLWSLGIEEQFYIFFPLVLYLAYKKSLNFYFIISIILIISFLDNIYISKINRTIDFYSPLTRFWELLIGAFFASLVRKRFTRRIYLIIDNFFAKIIFRVHVKNNGQSLSLLFSIIGFSLLFISLLVCHSGNWWPAWKALLPVFGALFIILAGPINVLSRYFLCNRISIFFGKISYPLYLWHWVFFSYLYIIFGTERNLRYHKLLFIVISVIIAYITYIFIEKPIRFNNCNNNNCILLIICLFIISSIGLNIYYLSGLPGRKSMKEYTEISYQLKDHVGKDGTCDNIIDNEVLNNLEFCRFNNVNSMKTIAIIGDSHSRVAYHGISKLGEIKKYNTLFLGRFQPKSKNNDIITNILINNNSVTKVFMILRGQVYITGMDVSTNYTLKKTSEPFGLVQYIDMLQKHIDILFNNGKSVYLVTEVPELPESPRNFCKRPFNYFSNKFPIVYKKDVMKRQGTYLKSVAKLQHCTIINTIDKFCDNSECFVFSDQGIPIYLDDDHLSFWGSEYLANNVLYKFLIDDFAINE